MGLTPHQTKEKRIYTHNENWFRKRIKDTHFCRNEVHGYHFQGVHWDRWMGGGRKIYTCGGEVRNGDKWWGRGTNGGAGPHGHHVPPPSLAIRLWASSHSHPHPLCLTVVLSPLPLSTHPSPIDCIPHSSPLFVSFLHFIITSIKPLIYS